jgi:Leucine-rich repeat (LRR) protein
MKKKLLILLFLASLSTYAQTNLVPNGNFETWTSSSQPDNWFRYFSGFTSQSTSAQNGTSSTNMMIADGTFNYINSEFFPVVANKTYRITLYHKLVSGSFSAIDLSLYHKPGTFKEEIIKKTDVTFSNTEWHKIEYDYTPTVSENIEVDIWTTGTLNSEILVDNVSVIDVATIGAQYTLIPDLNFEKKLIALGIDSGVADGKVLTNSIDKLTTLNVKSSSITDLTGIQDFVSLTTLVCNSNQLTNLNVTKNVALIKLYCHNNKITNLDVAQNINLKELMCHFNEITSIDISKNSKLEILDCLNNKITSLDISKNPLITELACENNQLTFLNLKNGANTILDLTYSNFVNNPNLTCIQVDDAIYSNANWSSIKDKTANFNTDCATSNLYTYIPDVNFEKKLISLGIDSGFADGKVLTVNVASLTSLDVSNSNISNLAGIENFTSLNKLDCGYNKLSTLNVSNSKNLNELICRYNDLTALDVSANTNLTSLDCIFNHITALDVSNLLALTSLLCVDNQLTNLDVTKNLYLDWFSCNSNQLTTLDVSQNKILRYLDCGFNQLTSLDISNNLSIFYLNCYHNKLSSLDVSMLTELTTLACSENQFSSFDVSKNVKLSSLLCENINVSTLDLSNNTALTELYCGNNEQLTTLDLSKNKKLTTFLCFNNHLTELNIKNGTNTLLVDVDFRSNSTLTCIQVDDATYSNTNWASKKDITASYSTNCTSYTLIPDSNFEQKLIDLGIDTDGLNGKVHISKISTLTSLDVSKSGITSLIGIEDFVALTSLDCSSNQLISLDVSKNKALQNFSCNSNQLTYLNLKNGNNSNFNTISFIDNPKLSCILVDDSDYSNANWSDKKDNTASYNTECIVYALIPDSSFEQKLIDLGIDTDGLNGKISTANINSITSLDLSNSNITDLTGIQDFVALTYLDCNTNKIKTIDVSNNKLLTKLALYDNQLTNLDVTKNTQLLNLECSNNQLSSIDLSQNTKLFHLGIGHNQLSSLDISVNIDLQSIYCYENNLTSLNIKNQTALLALECGLNNITALDLSTNTKLESLGCYNMQLTALDLTANVLLKRLSAGSNQLTTLDLSKNNKLELVFLEFNPLTSLNLQNGNNKNFILPSATGKTTTNLYCSFANNSKLGCIKVDDEAFSNANWSKIKDATATYSATCSALGIEDSVFDKVAIFPNPTQGELHIDNIVLEKATVYDALGKLVKTTAFTSGAKDNTMHLEGFPSGIYYIYLESEGANTAKKIIVK